MSESRVVPPLEVLFTRESGSALPLEGELARLFGTLRLPLQAKSPAVIGNFVTTLDGVVALNVRGHMSGGAISGFNRQDQALVGLLRSVSDAVLIGAGTMRVERGTLLTPAAIAPWLTADYQALRARLGRRAPTWNVIISASGELDLSLPGFQAGDVPVLVITTEQGLARLRTRSWGPTTQVLAVQEKGSIAADVVVETVGRICGGSLWLVEGGPHLLSDFLASKRLDELFLTLAPQVAGRAESVERPGLVTGTLFAPDQPRWGELIAVRRAEHHLFLRYAFKRIL
jgi:riboflavin biosynthesis pyrimidine reductase